MQIENASKKNVLDQFKLLAKQITYDIDFAPKSQQIKHMFRLKAINNTIKIISSSKNDIIKVKDFENIKGLGEKSLQRIAEIIKTGKLKEIKITSEDKLNMQYIEELEEIFGIGRKLAYKLFTEYKIKSIKELKIALQNKIIDLPDNAIKGLKYYDQLNDKIPRKEIDEVKEYLSDELFKIDIELFGTVCGSYRRQSQTSGDVDFVIVHPKLTKTNFIKLFVERLTENKFIVDSLTDINVPTKYMGIFRWKDGPLRRIDIRFIPYESYYSAILYFTGPKDFNRKMRQTAISNGYILNEYGLFDKSKMFKVESEKEIFDLLDMEYLTPDKRK